FYCPDGSAITGYELAPSLIEKARRRSYVHESGQRAAVTFACQGVAETLRDCTGVPVPDGSLGLINASGVVGHHLNANPLAVLAAEVHRVLRPLGVAMLDVGPALGDGELTPVMTSLGFRRLGRYRSWLLDPTGQVVFQKA